MAQFNFKETFEKIGKIFVQGLSRRIKQQTGVDGGAYSAPEASTLKTRRSLKKKASQSTKRLLVTYDFANQGFGYTSMSNGVKVFAKGDTHRTGGISYKKIVEYNSKGQANVNRHIKNPPLVFPTNPGEVLLMKNEFEQAKRIFAADAKKQMQEMAKINLKIRLNVG